MMTTSSCWILDPPQPQAGDPGPIVIYDSQSPTSAAPICRIEGKLEYQRGDANTVRRLDDGDIARARLIAAAPRLHSAIASLVAWAAYMGGWDAPCWREAEAVLRNLTSDFAD
jgi:hypothetical protein